MWTKVAIAGLVAGGCVACGNDDPVGPVALCDVGASGPPGWSWPATGW